MLWIIGCLIVITSVMSGYMAGGGHLHVLWQPFEFLIILGASAGALLTASTRSILTPVRRKES